MKADIPGADIDRPSDGPDGVVLPFRMQSDLGNGDGDEMDAVLRDGKFRVFRDAEAADIVIDKFGTDIMQVLAFAQVDAHRDFLPAEVFPPGIPPVR